MMRLILGDALESLKTLPDESVHCCVTSPPYWNLRDYGVPGQIGLEKTVDKYVERLVAVFREVRRILRNDATLWLNLGDSYASGKGTCYNPGGGPKSYVQEKERYPLDRGNKSLLEEQGLKSKDLCGIPWMVAFALRADGWYLRSDIIWAKPNPMPESVTDRPTKSHEYVFLLSKAAKYYFDQDAVKEESTTNDIRRPYGSPGANALDPREHPQGNGRPRTFGKWGDEDPQSSGRRIVESVKLARANGGAHDAPFGLTRNLRSVWTISTTPFPGSHFAVFPERLVEPCIKAGSSEKGCCPECGSPWVRIIKRQGTGRVYERGHCDADHRNIGSPQHTGSGSAALSVVTTTTGWRPTCLCGEYGTCATDDITHLPPVPCTVVDPFTGSGTTGVVAQKLGRNFVGIELSPEYMRMAEKRI